MLVALGVALAVAECVGDGVAEATAVGVWLARAVGVGVGEAGAVIVGAGVAWGLPESLPAQPQTNRKKPRRARIDVRVAVFAMGAGSSACEP